MTQELQLLPTHGKEIKKKAVFLGYRFSNHNPLIIFFEAFSVFSAFFNFRDKDNNITKSLKKKAISSAS